MEYFKINNTDFSKYVNSLNVTETANFSAQVNAAGNTVCDFINKKRSIEVGIIPLDSEAMVALQSAISGFNVTISLRNPNTGLLEENINCIIAENAVSYYTIRADKVLYNAFSLIFTEL